MKEVSTIGLDLAKNVFQVHGVDGVGGVVIRRALRRSQVLVWFAKLPRCLVGMEACATAHYWARELEKLGHEVRLIAPAYAKAYVRRNKNDPADAAAICEAVGRPSMRFVAIKSTVQQAAAGIHRVRDLLMKQHTMLRNQLRGLMAEFGLVAAKGQRGLSALIAILVDPEDRRLPSPLREGLVAIVETLRGIDRKLEAIDRQLVQAGRENATYRHLITAPGYGPILASAMVAMVVDPGAFRRGDDFAAALGPCSSQGQALDPRFRDAFAGGDGNLLQTRALFSAGHLVRSRPGAATANAPPEICALSAGAVPPDRMHRRENVFPSATARFRRSTSTRIWHRIPAARRATS